MNKGFRNRIICLFLTLVLAAGSMTMMLPQSVLAASRPKKTSFTSVTATEGGFLAYWNVQAEGTEGYEIRYNLKGSSEAVVREVSGPYSYCVSVPGLQPGRKYQVRIRTYRGSGEERVRSYWSKPLTVKIKWSNWQKSARRIYRYFRKKGMNDVHIAAILGCLYLEGQFDPTSVETIFTESYRIGPRKKAAERAGFRMKKINKKYAKTYPSIVRAGIGMMAWTDTKDMAKGQGGNTQLRAYAAERGKKWYNPYVQLSFFWNGRGYIEGYKNWHGRERFEKARTLKKATHVFLCYWLSGWVCRDSKDYHETINLKGRQAQAKRFYRFITDGYYD